MKILQGKSACNGIAMGKLFFHKRSVIDTQKRVITDVDFELNRFYEAKATAISQLQQLYHQFIDEIGENQAQIFEIHQMMLEDEDYCGSIQSIITEECANAEYAIGKTAEQFAVLFENMDDSYMNERAADVKDISNRLLHLITNTTLLSLKEVTEPIILAADDLAPSETIQMDKTKILGFVTCGGSTNSHTAILARTLNIPAIVSVGDALAESMNGKFVILNGYTGEIFIDPNQDTINKMKQKQEEQEIETSILQTYKGKNTVTRSGKEILLYANVGSLDDITISLANDAEGIGLFRSEFLYLGCNEYPTEETQFQVYKQAAELTNGKRLIIRTLDIGADKQVDYFNLPKEENPALGFRAIRICLTRPELFKTQLRAILRASAFGKIAIMFPMIISVGEIIRCKEIVNEVKQELTANGIAFDTNIEIGIMIETPAAAITSDLLAKEVDFFSIGTNDLTQYTIAIDRQNQMLEPFYNPHHEAILRLIELTTKNAHEAGIWVGICGELGADTQLLSRFIEMGIDELSVTPSAILPMRKKIREMQ